MGYPLLHSLFNNLYKIIYTLGDYFIYISRNSNNNFCVFTSVFLISGPYDPQSYYFLAQYADAQCSSLTGITMMAVNKCFSQTLSSTQTNTASYVGFTTTQYAKATFTQGTTTTSGTFTLTSYSDSSCNNVVSGSTPITVTLPAAAQNSQYGPFGMMSACTNTLPGSTSTTLYNQGGAYTFTNKLEMEALLSTATQGLQGPVYGTFADPYCSVQNTNDAVGNQLPIYMQWALNGACTYSLLTKQFKSETCSSSTNLANTAAYSNTWRTFSDSTCTTQIATQTSPETDVRDVAVIFSLPCFHSITYSHCYPCIFFSFSFYLALAFVPRQISVPSRRIQASPTTRAPSLGLTVAVTAPLAVPTSTWYWSNTTETHNAARTESVQRPSTPSSSTSAFRIPPMCTRWQPFSPAPLPSPVGLKGTPLAP